MTTNKNTKKKTEKKTDAAKELTLYKTFADEVSNVHYTLFRLKEDTFNGEITHKELVERLFELCYSLDKALDTVEGVEDDGYDDGYDDDDEDWD